MGEVLRALRFGDRLEVGGRARARVRWRAGSGDILRRLRGGRVGVGGAFRLALRVARCALCVVRFSSGFSDAYGGVVLAPLSGVHGESHYHDGFFVGSALSDFLRFERLREAPSVSGDGRCFVVQME